MTRRKRDHALRWGSVKGAMGGGGMGAFAAAPKAGENPLWWQGIGMMRAVDSGRLGPDIIPTKPLGDSR
jgi:hypothetical protein